MFCIVLVTLFELTVVNNWYIIMEGYAAEFTQWSRIYFMLFYLVTMVIMTVVVTYILEAFIFRIQYRKTVSDHELEGKGTTVARFMHSYMPAEQCLCGCCFMGTMSRYLFDLIEIASTAT